MEKRSPSRMPDYHCRNCGSTDVALLIQHLKRRRAPTKLYYCQPCFDAAANLSCATCDLRTIAAEDSAPNSD